MIFDHRTGTLSYRANEVAGDLMTFDGNYGDDERGRKRVLKVSGNRKWILFWFIGRRCYCVAEMDRFRRGERTVSRKTSSALM